MICSQLAEASQMLIQLNPKPSLVDIARVICGNCDRLSICPGLTIEFAEELDSGRTKPSDLSGKDN